jgi:hypothetical protein
VGDEKKKQLMPYSPNASRNRPAETRTNTVGRRTIPSRNASQIRCVGMRFHCPSEFSPPRLSWENVCFDSSAGSGTSVTEMPFLNTLQNFLTQLEKRG